MAVYQGFNGSVTFNSSTVAQCQGFEIVTGIESLDYTSFGDKWKRMAGGLASGTFRLSCKLDYATGQKEFLDDVAAATPTLVGATGVFTTASGDTVTATIIPLSITIGTRVEDLVTLEVSGVLDGAPTLSM